MQQIIDRHLEPAERVELSRSYRSLRETFADIDAIGSINAKLAESQGAISNRQLSLSIDISPRAAWERTLVPHLDDLPFQFVGKGEQSTLKIMLALNKKVEDSHVILVEEPENHLSFSSLNMLMERIARTCADKQVLVTTHSSFVLNKLGLGNLILLTPDGGCADHRPAARHGGLLQEAARLRHAAAGARQSGSSWWKARRTS